MAKIKGFILLVTLIFIQVLTLLSLATIQLVLKNFKLLEDNYQFSRHFYLAENSFKKIYFELNQQKLTCVIDETICPWKMPLKWWQEKGCLLNETTYFVIQKLNTHLCMKINSNNQIALVDYWQVTILSLFKNHTFFGVGEIAALTHPMQNCSDFLAETSLGWRGFKLV